MDIFCVMAWDSNVPPGMEQPQAILRRALSVNFKRITALTIALKWLESHAQISFKGAVCEMVSLIPWLSNTDNLGW